MFFDPTCKPETKIEPWRKLLLDAAAVMEKRGHCQFYYEDKQRRVCLLGAMRIAHHGHSECVSRVPGTYWHAERAEQALVAKIGRAIASWNDAPGRTKEEAVAVLRQAANG